MEEDNLPCGRVEDSEVAQKKKEEPVFGSEIGFTTCYKCKTEQLVYVARGNEPLCKLCFQNQVFAKTASNIPHRYSTSDLHKYLLVFSENHPSNNRVLANILHENMYSKKGERKFQRFLLESVWVEPLNSSIDNQLYRNDMIEIAKKYDIPFHSLLLDGYSNVEIKFEDESSKEYYYDIIRSQTLVKFALKIGARELIEAESAQELAQRVVSSIARGRGFSLPFDIASRCSLLPSLGLIRPLLDILPEEIELYDRIILENNSGSGNNPKNPNNGMTIEKLSKEFISNLQKDFPQTVHTILRTVAKLNTPGADTEFSNFNCKLIRSKRLKKKTQDENPSDCDRCDYCFAPLSEEDIGLNTVLPPPGALGCGENGEANNSCCSSNNRNTCCTPQLDTTLLVCYSCSRLQKQLENPLVLNHELSSHSKTRQRLLLREKIEDFLLDDGESD